MRTERYLDHRQREDMGGEVKDIFKIGDTEVHETENGTEYAAMPVHHPAVPGTSPHGWMGVVNGHIIGVMLTSEAAALIQAEGVANMPARN